MRKLPDLLTPTRLSEIKASATRAPIDEAFLLGDARQGVLVRAITPVLGGNVESFDPGEIDVVRVPSIRGAVRWWWRALHPELSIGELRERERRVWGGVGRNADEPSCASPVRIDVCVTKRSEPAAAGNHGWRDSDKGKVLKALPDWNKKNAFGYALFPLQQPDEERKKSWRQDLEFELRVRVFQRGSLALSDDDQQGVRDAVCLWLTFGGYGARTRRGFGALHTDAVSYDDMRRLLTRLKGNAQKERPTLAQCVLLEGPQMDKADDALGLLLDALKTFRQGTSFGRDPGQTKRFGRSRWPEADSLRTLSGGTFRAHPPDQSHRSPSAPRAEFGLPIVVKFTREDERANGTIASTKDGGRWASPMLLRPVCRGNKYVPVVLVLAGHRPQEAWAIYNDKNGNANGSKVSAIYEDARHGGARNLVRDTLIRSRGHALDAFANWLMRERQFYKPEGA